LQLVSLTFALHLEIRHKQERHSPSSRDILRNYVSPVAFASCYAAMGEREKTFAWLERAYKERATGLISLEVNNHLDNLRSDPRFRELERRVGL
jgi:hypothetical protein